MGGKGWRVGVEWGVKKTKGGGGVVCEGWEWSGGCEEWGRVGCGGCVQCEGWG